MSVPDMVRIPLPTYIAEGVPDRWTRWMVPFSAVVRRIVY